MSNAKNELFADLEGVCSDLLHVLSLKRQLAEEEIRHDLRQVRSLVIFGGVGSVTLLTGLPVLIISLALLLDGRFGFGAAQWALLFGIPLILCGATIIWAAWSRFRRAFLGLRESVQELREDVQWIKDWLE